MYRNLWKAVLVALALAGGMAAQAAAPASPQGFITAKAFLNINGTAVADLTGNAKFPNNPDLVMYPPYFEFNATGDIGVNAPNWADNYGAQMIGYFYPATSGDYIFYLSADDGANLYLSTDDTAANKKLIAQETGWSGARSYTSVGGGSTVEAKCSQTFTGTQWATKDPAGGAKITLTAGRAYYIEALVKEGGGGDNLSVSIDGVSPIEGSRLSTIDKTTGPVSITTQPASLTVNEGASATFAVVADGTPPYTYQWRKNGTAITDATNRTYTVNRAYRTDNGAKYSVVVTGGQGTVTSADATLTVNNDTAGPTLVSAAGSLSFTTVTVTFSEPVDPTSAAVAANYAISGGVTVSGAALGATAGTAGDHRVVLTTSKQPEGATLELTVNNVKDVAGNAIAANSKTSLKTFVFASGFVLHKFWQGGNNFQSLIDGRTDLPTFVTIEPRWEYGPNGSNESGSDYGNELTGYFIPATSGNYVFFTCSDDPSNLYLSTDENPANKKLIAQETGWSNARNWVSVGSGDVTSKRSDQFALTEWPTFNTITLQAGKRYFMQSIHTEGGGGDNVGATFAKEGEADPANGDAPKFTGALIGTYLDPTGAKVDIATPPADATQQELRSATFTVVATGSSAYGSNVSYQWQKAPPGSTTFTDISGATTASYTTPILALADNGAQYRVVCSVPTLTVNSAAAKLTVVADTFAPKLEAAGSVMKGTAIEVGIGFDENVDPVSAGTAANYSLSKGTVTGVRYQRYAHTGGAGFFKLGSAGPHQGAAVVLTTSGLAGGDTVTVTVKNVKDVKGNAMSATGESKAFIVTKKMKWTAVGGNDYLEGELGGQNITPDPALWPDDVIAYSDADFDLIGSGTANWNAYDELTFVYEEVTGDFDKVVRVEYQDPTSQWARAGMNATPALDEGVTRAQVAGGYQMERRYMNRVNPVVQWNGTGGNNGNEADWRLTKGGNYGGAGAGNPAYPNAWLRMQRIGQVFNTFYSSDGKNWTSFGSQTFTDEPMPDKLFVGIYYCPEFGNNGSGEGVGHSTVGKFRQYGNYVAKPSEVSYGIGLNFGADEPNGAFGGILPTIGTAGVPGVVQGNWNNLTNAAGSATVIVADNKGIAVPTSVQVSWDCPNTWASTGRGEENNRLTTNDKILMTGYLDTGGASTTKVTISGLPTQLTGANGYDVYVYALGGVGGRGGGYRVTDATGTALTEYIHGQSPTNPTNFVQITETAGTWTAGTYLVFKGLKAANIVVEATTEGAHGYGGTKRAPINAIQLVPAGSAVQPPGAMTIARAAGNVTIDWAGGGTLQSATAVTGPWTDVGTTKPYTGAIAGQTMFFRVKGQ